jgi:hypothetical protein
MEALCTFPEFGVCPEVICITSAAFHAGSAFIVPDPGRFVEDWLIVAP